jgi:hypothetical protein
MPPTRVIAKTESMYWTWLQESQSLEQTMVFTVVRSASDIRYRFSQVKEFEKKESFVTQVWELSFFRQIKGLTNWAPHTHTC